MSPRLVFIPIAASEATIKNLLMALSQVETPTENKPKLFSNDIPTNARINHGNKEVIVNWNIWF